jgi:hypothetical protein
MGGESRGFRAALAILQTALAMALTVQISPARAEAVTLICENTSGTNYWPSFTLKVDYDRKTVELLVPDGRVFLSSEATVTQSNVSWTEDSSRWDSSSQKPQGFAGGVNRLSGQGFVRYIERQVVVYSMSGPCRRATQKF